MPNLIPSKPLATTPNPISSNVQNAPSPTPPTGKTSEVNSVQSTPAGKNKSKKGKGKNKEDKNNPQSEKTKTPPVDDKDKRKPRYPCLICGDDHYTKDCPRRAEVTKFLQGTPKPPTPAVLSQPFPSQQQAQLVIHDQPSPSNTSYVLMCTGDSKKNDITLTTRAKDYSSSKEKVDDNTSFVGPTISHDSTYQRSSSSRMTEPRYSSSPSPKGCCSKICFQSSCTCCPELQYCRRSGPSTIRDVSPRSPSELSYTTEGTVESYWWNRPYGYKFNNF
jgi:hypothetical protein